MDQGYHHIPRRRTPAVVDLISSDDDEDDDDDEVESLSGDEMILASLAARARNPHHMHNQKPPNNAQQRVEVILSSASPEPQPLPVAPRVDLQPPRFEDVARQGRAAPPRAFLDLDSEDGSDFEFGVDSDDDYEALLEGMKRQPNLPPHQPQAPHQQAFPQGAPQYWDENNIDKRLQERLLAQFLREDLAQAFPQAADSAPNSVIRPIKLEQNGNDARVHLQRQPNPPVMVEDLDQILATVSNVFPGICLEYVRGLYPTLATSSERMIAHILDRIEKGTPWPKAKDNQKSQKRKRDLDEDEQATLKYGAVDRIVGGNGRDGLSALVRDILREEFPETPMTFVNATLGQSGYRLFSAYRVLEAAQRTFDPAAPVYNKIKPRKIAEFTDIKVESLLKAFGLPQDRKDVLEELKAARRIRRKAEDKRREEKMAELAEEENTRQAERDGTTGECSCCCGDYPLNRMVHCNGKVEHMFCRQCALKNAETLVGNSKYELSCMSMDGCIAGFSVDQRLQFLTPTTIVALERNEQEAVLRMAGIENLASCPFCPYAAEYPPIEENKEFHCKMPDCEKISCRLCNLESHIPKSCEEFAKENGLSIRREIEEAMTAALIRRCNKCETPFIKEEGCNKMTCSRPGCHNIQCYVCSKSCSYDHFDDRTRGGKEGNCPLFESVSERHEKEVKAAELAALAKVRAKHPEYTAEDLMIRMSDNVARDDERRKANDPRANLMARVQGHVLGRLPPGGHDAARARFDGHVEYGNLQADPDVMQALLDVGGVLRPVPYIGRMPAPPGQGPRPQDAVADLRRMEAVLHVQEAQDDRERHERAELRLAAERRLEALRQAVPAPANAAPRPRLPVHVRDVYLGRPVPFNQRPVAVPLPQLRTPPRIPVRVMPPHQQPENQAARHQQRVQARVDKARSRLRIIQDPPERRAGAQDIRDRGREAFLLAPVPSEVPQERSPEQVHRDAQERIRQRLLDRGHAHRAPQPRPAPDFMEID